MVFALKGLVFVGSWPCASHGLEKARDDVKRIRLNEEVLLVGFFVSLVVPNGKESI